MSIKEKILYVDDEEINLLIFEKNLEKKYDVITASSGKEGLEVLTQHSEIKLVFSDLRMPGMSGIEFIQKARETFDDKKFFILTGYDSNEEIEKSLKDELFLQFWTRPVNYGELIKTLEKGF